MIEVLKDTVNVASKTLHITAYVELNEHDETEYKLGCGPVVDVETIAKLAIQKSSCLTNKELYGIFANSIKDSLDICSDDCYEYETIEQMLKQRCYEQNIEFRSYWNSKYTTLEETSQTVEYNGKTFNTHIIIFINK